MIFDYVLILPLTAATYLLFPFVFSLLVKKCSKFKLILFCICNALFVKIVFAVLFGSTSANPMFLWGYISYRFLKKKIEIVPPNYDAWLPKSWRDTKPIVIEQQSNKVKVKPVRLDHVKSRQKLISNVDSNVDSVNDIISGKVKSANAAFKVNLYRWLMVISFVIVISLFAYIESIPVSQEPSPSLSSYVWTVGNRTSYHDYSCIYVQNHLNLPLTRFDNEKDAVRNGYAPCSKCQNK